MWERKREIEDCVHERKREGACGREREKERWASLQVGGGGTGDKSPIRFGIWMGTMRTHPSPMDGSTKNSASENASYFRTIFDVRRYPFNKGISPSPPPIPMSLEMWTGPCVAHPTPMGGR